MEGIIASHATTHKKVTREGSQAGMSNMSYKRASTMEMDTYRDRCGSTHQASHGDP